MKAKILMLILSLFVALNCCFGQESLIKIKLDETIYKDGKTCWKKSGEPLNGSYAIKMNPYQINNEQFINGLKHGETTIYRNKKLAEKGFYMNNLRENIREYYNEDGSVSKKRIYKNGLQDSTETIYYKNEIVETLNFSKNHLNGWANKFSYIKPHQLTEKAFYIDGKKIKNISYKTIDSLNFTIVDSLFYNDKKQLKLKKSFINDTLKLQIEFKYNVAIKDAFQRNTTQVNIYNDEKLNITYYFPSNYDDQFDSRMFRLLTYQFTYYADKKNPALLISNPTEGSFDKETFYRQFPNGNIQSVIYSNGDGDVLPGYYYRDLNK